MALVAHLRMNELVYGFPIDFRVQGDGKVTASYETKLNSENAFQPSDSSQEIIVRGRAFLDGHVVESTSRHMVVEGKWQ